MEKERYELISRVCDRGEEMGIAKFRRITHMIDLELADKAFDMDWEGLLNADSLDFAHDFCGISNSINRNKYNNDHMTVDFNFFVPRYGTERRRDEYME